MHLLSALLNYYFYIIFPPQTLLGELTVRPYLKIASHWPC